MRLLTYIVMIFSCSIVISAPPVSAVAYSPDGKILVAGSKEAAYLFDAEKHSLLAELSGQTTRVTAVAISAKVNVLAIASGSPGKSGVIKLYDIQNPATPKDLGTINAHKDIIYTLDFHPDGKTLASGGYDRLVKIWSMDKFTEPTLTLTDHSDTIFAVSYHPNGKQLATSSADRSIKVLDLTTGKRLYTLSESAGAVYALAWHPQGKLLAGAGVDKSIRVWEDTKLIGAAFAHTAPVTRILFPKEGDTFYTVGEDRVIKQWNITTLKETHTFATQSDTILAASIRPDGKRLAVARYDGVFNVIDTTSEKVLAELLPLKAKPKNEPMQAQAKVKPPELTKASVDSITRGQKIRVKLEGSGLAGVHKINGLAVDTKIVSSKDQECVIELTSSKDSNPGLFQLTVSSPAGESKPLNFWVDRFQRINEVESAGTDSAVTATLIKLPITVAGKLNRTGDMDYYRFEAKAGEQIGFQLFPSTTDGKIFIPIISIAEANRTILHESSSKLLGFTAPRDGTYILGVHDQEYRGGAGIEYHINIGPFPVVTGVFPLGITRGRDTIVHISGVNLGESHGSTVKASPPITTEIGSKFMLTLPSTLSETPAGVASVTVGEFPSSIVTSSMAELKAPATADGIVNKDVSTVKFQAKKGEPLVLEVHASRFGSPLDSIIEIQDIHGKPVPRVVLRSVAQVSNVLRDVDSEKPGIRLDVWSQLATNDYVYFGTELMRIKAMPKNPDDDCQFVQVAGKRAGFLGTTPTQHPIFSPLYKVQFHPPGSTFPPNGLPVFTLMYRNDDGGAGFGKDSMLIFDPPDTGSYQVKVADTRGQVSSQHAFRLTVRPPKPDFKLSVSPINPKVWKNGGIPITITATRIDGYNGPIDITFPDVVSPWQIPPTIIEAEQTTANTTLYLNGNPTDKPVPIRIVGTGKAGTSNLKQEVSLGTPTAQDTRDLTVTTSVNSLQIQPGGETRMIVKIERLNGFKGRVPLDVLGLPHGVRVENIGLNGILILPDETEREVVIAAESWVKPIRVPVTVLAKNEAKKEDHAAKPLTLTIGK